MKLSERMKRVLLMMGIIGGMGCLQAQDTVVFALKPDKDPEKMQEEKGKLEAYLGKELGKKVEVVIPLSSAVILQGLENGSIDAGYLSGTDMVGVKDAGTGEILVAGEIEGNPWYKSYWISLKEKPYTSVEDLKGKSVAFSSATSTSGFVIPYWDLVKKGLLEKGDKPEKYFGEGNVFYGTGYVSAAERVLNGDAEAAAVSYYVLDKDKHLNAEQRAKLKMIASQQPVPTHVIAVRSALDKDTKTALKAAVLKLNEDENTELRDKLFTSKLIVVEDEDAHLESIQEALELVKAIH